MKIIVSVLFVFVVACNSQTQIPATVTWGSDSEATQYHLFVWTGTNPADNPLVEDSSYSYISTLGLVHYTINHPTTELIFQTPVNGEYIQLAGFNENSAGLTAGATLSNLVLKPNLPNKMQILNLEL